MSKRISFHLDMANSDLFTLQMALSSARNTKFQILKFYEDNPEEPVITPLDPLRSEIDALDRLICIFKHGGTYESD